VTITPGTPEHYNAVAVADDRAKFVATLTEA
jgi:hypothetical protein